MPEESVDKGFAGKIGVVMRVPLKQGLKPGTCNRSGIRSLVVMRVPLKQGKSKLNISRYVKQH